MSVDTAVIPVAGFGTRMLPASKSIPKTIIPVVDRPVIDYVVREAVRAGCRRIVLVTNTGSVVIENYFDKNALLESELREKGKNDLLEQVKAWDLEVVSVRQHEPRGLGYAISCASPVVGRSPFVVLLPDVLVDCGGQQEDLAAMTRRFEKTGAAQVMVEEVAPEHVSRYGIVSLSGSAPTSGDFAAMTGVVEKPAPEDAPSRLAVVGRYVLPAEIFPILEGVAPDASGEIQLTDAIDELIEKQNVEAYAMCGKTFDCGNKAGYLEATLHFALQHEELGAPTRELMKRLLD
jgi:UTP--glucose-1-phosphate uridylyltransferase